MPDEIRRKKKTTKKKSAPSSGHSTLILSILGGIVAIGIVVVIIIISTNRSGSRQNVAAVQTPAMPESTTNALPSPASNQPGVAATSTGATPISAAAPAVYAPSITDLAQPLQDQPVSDQDRRFDVRLPVGWTRGPERLFTAQPESVKGTPDEHRRPAISVIPSPQPPGRKLDDLVTDIAASRQKEGQPLLEDRPAKIAGHDARRVVYETPMTEALIKAWNLQPNEKSRTLMYLVGPVDNVIFLMTLGVSTHEGRFEKMLPTFEAIMSTVRFPAGPESK